MFRVTSMLETGEVVVSTGDEAPKKGDSYEYEHTEIREGQVIKVEEIDDDGNVTVLTELSDLHHAIEEPEEGDEVPEAEELADDPVDEPEPAPKSDAKGKKS